MRFSRNKNLPPTQDRAGLHAVVETEDHERVTIDGCSADEVAAKLKDFYAWAS